MKLDSITLQNFRQYYGRQRVSFSKDAQRNVTVIHGINGAGKTSFFLGINWCLYGEGVSNVGELISKEAICQTPIGQTVITSVELSFIHDGERYIVSRRLGGVKQSNGALLSTSDHNFTMLRTRWDGQSERVNNPVGTMNAILPSNVRTYFLFDGEKIDNFAKPEASEEVRYAIYNVLKLEILARARKHLEDAAAEYRRELKSASSGELRELIEEEEKLRDEKEGAQARMEELNEEIQSASRKIREIDQRLRTMQNAQSLQQQRDRLQRDLQQRELERDKLIGHIRSTAVSSFIVLAQPGVQQALTILEEKRERGEIPSNIRQQFIQDLIDRRHCICGRPFEINSDEHHRLLSLMDSSLPGSLEDDVLDTCAALRTFDERGQGLKDVLDRDMRRKTELVDEIKALAEELDDVSRQLKGSPLEEIKRLENQREGFRADIETDRLEQGTIETRIEAIDKEIAHVEKQIDQAKKDQKKQSILNRKVNLTQGAANAINNTYQIFADDMRKRIEAKTKEIFKSLVWKNSHFQDVLLGPDYKLEVIDRYGMPARPELSAGERQVLSLSFITAMARISEEEAPLVMDTPFGRLSSHHRNSIAEHMPELADQLVLFVTDEELRDQSRENLEPRIGSEYRLEFDHDTSCTNIVEVV